MSAVADICAHVYRWAYRGERVETDDATGEVKSRSLVEVFFCERCLDQAVRSVEA